MEYYNETDAQVWDYLQALGATCSCRYRGEDRSQDVYSVRLTRGTCIISEFRQGLGYRVRASRPILAAEAERVGAEPPHLKDHNGEIGFYRQNPAPATILYHLLSDAQLGDESFEDFCADLGLDSDSRRALALHEDCQATNTMLRRLFSSEEREQLTKMLEDY